MANEEHLTILRQGVEVWNGWRKANGLELKPDLTGADLRGADLRGTDLRGAYLRATNLSDANLAGSNLFEANLDAANLERADLRDVDLRFARILGGRLRRANLSRSDLRSAYLRGVKLQSANLEGANLSGAELSFADLRSIRALGTNFKSATLTGVCFEWWSINDETNLDNIICEYVYLRMKLTLSSIRPNHLSVRHEERCPSDPNKTFEPGEFTKLFKNQNDFSNTQDLAQATSQIQALLAQLQQQGHSPEDAQQQVANDLAEQAKKDPTTLGKLVMWGQKLGDATVTDVVKGVVKMALRAAGVPLP